jgi:hypothetical protein
MLLADVTTVAVADLHLTSAVPLGQATEIQSYSS